MIVLPRIALVSACVALFSGCLDGEPDPQGPTPFTASGDGTGGAPSIDSPNGLPPDAEMQTFCSGECDPRRGKGCERDDVCDVQLGRSICLGEDTSQRGEEGEPCQSSLDCLPGLGCFELEGEPEATCQAFCCGVVSSECGPGSRCKVTPTVEGEQGSWGRCVETTECDVLEPAAACAEDEGCYVISVEGATDCMIAGTSGVGEECSFVGDCAPGALCTGRVDPTCVQVCRLEGFDSCPEGELCRGYAHTQPSGLGLCTSADDNPL